MNVLFDTDILIEILSDADDVISDSVYLLNKAEKKRISGWISPVTIQQLTVYLEQNNQLSLADDIIRNLMILFRVTTIDEKITHAALKSPLTDFRTALLAESAKASNLDCIVSNNRALWEERNIRVLTPSDLRTIIEYSGI